MKTNKYLIASAALGLALLSATPVFADSNGSVKVDGNVMSNFGLHLGSLVNFFSDKGQSTTSRDKDNDGDRDDQKATSSAVAFGTVSNVNGSTFTVSGKNGTTTVTTNASTVFKTKGGATTSAALAAGARVIVVGSSTSTTTPNSITASIVIIFSKTFGFFKHLFHH